jgi:MerR family transcriptional regulator, mercuric resistance operon regulatory protein
MNSLTIAGLAHEAGVGVETIRFYQRKGLIPKPERPLHGVRHYGLNDVERVHSIKAAQRVGFTLAEIAQLMALRSGAQCAEARELAERKLVDVRAHLSDLRHIESTLVALIARCDANEADAPCPMIETLRKA